MKMTKLMFRHKDTKTLNNSMMIFSVFGGSDKSGVSSISFSCSGCKHWMQKNCRHSWKTSRR